MKILERGIYLIVFCLPLYLVRFSILNTPTTLLELMIYGLFVFWLIKARWRGIKEVVIKIKKIVLPIVLILIGVSVATIFSWNLRLSAGIWKAWFIDPILFFIVVSSIIKKPEQVAKVFYSLIFSGFVVSVVSLIYLIFGKLDESGRLQGFYTSPNYLAMYLAPVLIIGLFFVWTKIICPKTRVGNPASCRALSRPRPDRALGLQEVFLTNNLRPNFLFFVACILLLVACLFLTKSFGAWLGIILALVFGLIAYLSKSKPAQGWSASGGKLIWGIIFCLLAIVLIFGFLKINSIQGKLSFNSRLEIWQRASDIFKLYPIIGIGPGTFHDFFIPYPRWGVPQPHNLYLAFLLQTGIIGFIGFIWLIVWFFRTGFKNLFKVYSSEFIVILMSVMVYILIHGLVDTTYWKNDLSAMFWLTIGLMAILKKNPD